MTQLRGQRAWLTALHTRETVPVRISDVEGEDILATMERRDDNVPVGTVLVECLCHRSHQLMTADVLQVDGKGTILLHPNGKVSSQPTDQLMGLILEPVPATLRNGVHRYQVQIIGGAADSMALVSQTALPQTGKSQLTFEDEGRPIEIEGYVTHCHSRGKGQLCDFSFSHVARVTSM